MTSTSIILENKNLKDFLSEVFFILLLILLSPALRAQKEVNPAMYSIIGVGGYHDGDQLSLSILPSSQ
ncbi:MAG: hypothetical protein IPJ40_06340 [Saprospirales bacterium]|nr:hypothetical protein [Saprospirales bacterium]